MKKLAAFLLILSAGVFTIGCGGEPAKPVVKPGEKPAAGKVDAGKTDAGKTDAGKTDAGKTDAGKTDDAKPDGDK